MKKMSKNNTKNIAIIGIRSGSKGIKNKNIKLLGNKHLFSWIIEIAKQSKVYDDILVSSDSQYYLDLVKQNHDYILPLLRDKDLARDDSPEYEFVKHTVITYAKENKLSLDEIIFSRLHATSPFQTPEDLVNSLKKLKETTYATSSVVIKKSSIHPLKSLKIIKEDNHDKLVSILDNSSESVTGQNRQSLGVFYHRSNVITGFGSNILNGNLTGKFAVPVLQNSEFYIDIDSEFDFWIAEQIIKNNLID